MPIKPGRLGKYELRERLGEGGMAEVWKAFDARLQRYVAIKFLHSTLRADPTFVTRFVREAQAVASLRHPNIVQIYDFETSTPGEEDSLAYMVMDYIEGPTLADYLRETSHAQKFPSATELVSLFFSIGEAVDYAHQRGLLHRDIKPANILLDRRHTRRNPMGEPILTDFGIVKMMGSVSGTLTSSSVGTPLYISPEQARGHPDTAASDLYSLGVVLYEACTGTPPFRGDIPLAILQQHITTPPPPPEQFNPAITPAQAEVMLRALAKDPAERFPSAAALTAALAEALQVELPEKRSLPISSPDIRNLAPSPEQVEDVPTYRLEPARPASVDVANPPSPLPPTVVDTPVKHSPAALDDLPTRVSGPVKRPAQDLTPLPVTVQPPRKKRGLLIALVTLLLVALAGSGLAAFLVFHNNGSSPTQNTIVGNAFFTSSGAASGANNLGINDTFQVRLTHIPPPAAGKRYYAWLLPDLNQTEANPLVLGPLTLTGGTAALPTAYVDPQHTNLVGQFSRFLVTEESANPAPQSYSLDKATWRYYAEIPQSSPINGCQGNITQLSVLCHLRHLLASDPELAQVNLQGGLNYWFLNNVEELKKWTQEAVDHQNAADVRHKIVNILYVLDGTNCIQQDLQHASPGLDNTPDDATLAHIAAIPLLSCSLTPNSPGYLAHIHNHLNAILQAKGVLSDESALAKQIGTELNSIGSWLQELQKDAQQLIAMDNTQLAQQNGLNLRNGMNTQAANVLSGGTDVNSGAPEKGVVAIADQIQQLATMDVMTYKAQ